MLNHSLQVIHYSDVEHSICRGLKLFVISAMESLMVVMLALVPSCFIPAKFSREIFSPTPKQRGTLQSCLTSHFCEFSSDIAHVFQLVLINMRIHFLAKFGNSSSSLSSCAMSIVGAIDSSPLVPDGHGYRGM